MTFDEQLAVLEKSIRVIDHHIEHYKDMWNEAVKRRAIVDLGNMAFLTTPHAYTEVKQVDGSPGEKSKAMLSSYAPMMQGYFDRFPTIMKRRRELAKNIKELVASQKTDVKQMPRKSVPDRVYTSYARTHNINNPYNKGSKDFYAGDLAGFDWAAMTATYLELKKILTRNGLAFNTIYSSTIVEDVRDKPRNLRTFAAVAGGDSLGGDVVWYKYESKSGMGNNYLYIKGHQFFTTRFLRKSPADQDKLLVNCHKP